VTGVKSFKEGLTEFENMRRLQLLLRKMASTFLGFSRRFIHRFFDRTTNYQCSLLFETSYRPSKASLSIKMTMSVSQKHLASPDNACPHTAAVTTGKLVKMHWEMLPHSACRPDLAQGDFHLFGPLKEALRGRRFRDDDEVELFVLS
jgi:hypothetical protein